MQTLQGIRRTFQVHQLINMGSLANVVEEVKGIKKYINISCFLLHKI